MIINMPLFLTNETWYTEDENGEYILTENAPQEAIDSYEQWLNTIEEEN